MLFKQCLKDSFAFGIVGTIGFIIDVAVLYSLVGLIGLFYGRVASFFAAVATTWLLNRRWTFKNRHSGLTNGHEFAVYLALMLIGGSVNYGVYVWLVVSYQLVQQSPVIGVAFGSLAGMLINFLGTRFILFRTVELANDNE